MISETCLQVAVSPLSSSRNVTDGPKLQLSPLITQWKLYWQGAILDPVSTWCHHEAEVQTGFTASPEWHHFLYWYLHAARQTANGWEVILVNAGLLGQILFCFWFLVGSNLVWISVNPVWTALWLPMWIWFVDVEGGRGAYDRGRVQEETWRNSSVYIIYLFKVITIQHKHTFSPQINMN